MREIKFRGIQVSDGAMIHGNLLCMNDKHYIMPFDYGDLNDLDFGYCFDEVISETVGQFTGLQDKNGKNIYEGDIIQYILNKHRYIVTMDNFCVGTIDAKGEKLRLGIVHNDFEIISNIYENPNLLEEICVN